MHLWSLILYNYRLIAYIKNRLCLNIHRYKSVEVLKLALNCVYYLLSYIVCNLKFWREIVCVFCAMIKSCIYWLIKALTDMKKKFRIICVLGR